MNFNRTFPFTVLFPAEILLPLSLFMPVSCAAAPKPEAVEIKPHPIVSDDRL